MFVLNIHCCSLNGISSVVSLPCLDSAFSQELANLVIYRGLKKNLSTSSLIRTSYTIRATIFDKVFDLKNSPKLSNIYFLASLFCSLLEFKTFIASLLCWEGKQTFKSKAGAIKCCNERNNTAPPNACHSIPFLVVARFEARSSRTAVQCTDH